jgi:hypothetical protein
MFEKFQKSLYKLGSYYVDELPGEVYAATHFDSESRGKWYKVKYTITVSGGYYTCECGMYEHMGMLCCHVLKVIDLGHVQPNMFGARQNTDPTSSACSLLRSHHGCGYVLGGWPSTQYVFEDHISTSATKLNMTSRKEANGPML